MNIRKSVFWWLDGLKGGQVLHHLRELDSESVSGKPQLQRILRHAQNTTAFYSKIDGNKLEAFPIVSKSIIKENISDFVSTSYVKNALSSVTTSGSTGTPFTVYQDSDKRARNTADTIYFAAKANYILGQKLYYLKIWSKANHKSFVTKFIQNIVTVDVLNLNDKVIESLLDDWQNQRQPFGIIGYASALESISKYLRSNSISEFKTKVNSIITISETLDPMVKEHLTAVFGVQVVSRYSNVENGIIAQQPITNENYFEVNERSYFIETFDLNEDKPVANGSVGRIVLTDLYNFGMPMIRYDTGDIGMIKREDGKLVLEQLSGRKLDVLYNTAGSQVNALLVYKNMWQYTELDQYQLIQKGKKLYQIIISSSQPFQRNEKMIQEFKSYLGNDAEISIIQVNEIPLLSSGKRRKVVQEYYK